jgi:hypothetical protein
LCIEYDVVCKDNLTRPRRPIMRLTTKQVEEVLAPSVKYPATAYADELARIVRRAKPEGRVEENFPGVKPAHVAHMLKRAADATESAVEVIVHGAHGVCVLPVS